MPELPELNPVIHGKLRLALLSLLSGVEEAEFTWLRAKTGSTDGNLGRATAEARRGRLCRGREEVRPAQAADALPHDRSRPPGADRIRSGAEAAARRGDLTRDRRAGRGGFRFGDSEMGAQTAAAGSRSAARAP